MTLSSLLFLAVKSYMTCMYCGGSLELKPQQTHSVVHVTRSKHKVAEARLATPVCVAMLTVMEDPMDCWLLAVKGIRCTMITLNTIKDHFNLS